MLRKGPTYNFAFSFQVTIHCKRKLQFYGVWDNFIYVMQDKQTELKVEHSIFLVFYMAILIILMLLQETHENCFDRSRDTSSWMVCKAIENKGFFPFVWLTHFAWSHHLYVPCFHFSFVIQSILFTFKHNNIVLIEWMRKRVLYLSPLRKDIP